MPLQHHTGRCTDIRAPGVPCVSLMFDTPLSYFIIESVKKQNGCIGQS